MTIKNDTLTQLDGLIEEGQQCQESFYMANRGRYQSRMSESDLRAFTARAFAAIARLAGKESEYYRLLPSIDLSKLIRLPSLTNSPSIIPALSGSLTALRDAVDNGHLESLENRIRAHVHDDFLEQAKDLLDSNYHVAAMVLIGGVLEDHLSKLCTKKGLTWNGHGSISKYNDACHQGTVYDKPTWRRIQSIGDLRNDAAHGQGADVKAPDVDDAYKFVGRFIADHSV